MRRLHVVRAITLAFVALALLGTVAAFRALDHRVQDLKIQEHSNPVWIVSQLEYEALRFDNALKTYLLGEVEAAQVGFRLDIMWSRVDVMSHGRHRQVLADYPDAVIALADIQAALTQLDTLVASFPPQADAASAAGVARALELSRGIKDRVHALILRVLSVKSKRDAKTRADFVTLAGWTRLLSVGTGVALSVLMIYAWLNAERQRRHSRAQQRLLREAQAASEAKSQFLSVVNHELRTPLTSIKGGISLLLGGADGVLSPRSERLLQIAHDNCERLGLIINDLLDLEKLEAGKMEFCFARESAASIVAETVEGMTQFARGHDVRIAVAATQGEDIVLADRYRMVQALTNLLSNAIKFSPRGGCVDVRIDRADRQLSIVVTDHGCGIPEEALGSIFEKFTQVDSSDKRAKGGTGLGLSIAKSIVEKHGGAIAVQSTLGQGTTFTITMRPALQQDRPHPPEGPAEAA